MSLFTTVPDFAPAWSESTIAPVEEVRALSAAQRGDGRYDPRVRYNNRTPAHKRRVLRRRGAR